MASPPLPAIVYLVGLVTNVKYSITVRKKFVQKTVSVKTDSTLLAAPVTLDGLVMNVK